MGQAKGRWSKGRFRAPGSMVDSLFLRYPWDLCMQRLQGDPEFDQH
jgi:hypothetical protein